MTANTLLCQTTCRSDEDFDIGVDDDWKSIFQYVEMPIVARPDCQADYSEVNHNTISTFGSMSYKFCFFKIGGRDAIPVEKQFDLDPPHYPSFYGNSMVFITIIMIFITGWLVTNQNLQFRGEQCWWWDALCWRWTRRWFQILIFVSHGVSIFFSWV